MAMLLPVVLSMPMIKCSIKNSTIAITVGEYLNSSKANHILWTCLTKSITILMA